MVIMVMVSVDVFDMTATLRKTTMIVLFDRVDDCEEE